MRTRRSPKNQDKLFKELFKATPVDKPIVKSARCYDCVYYPKQGRSTGHCTLKGDMVRGIMERSCFEARKVGNK